MNGTFTTSRAWHARRQVGSGLIEILIAMLIALFLMAGVVVVFVNLKNAFTSQDQLAQLQDNERLALTILTNTVQAAGYYPDPVGSTALLSLPASTNAVYGSLAAGQPISGTTGGAGANDVLTVQFATASGDGIMNCQGQTNTSGGGQVYINTFSISANNELQCSVNGATAVPLVSGVSAFNVLYGVDSNNNRSTDTYMTATQVATAGLWSSVRTARIQLRFITPFNNPGGQPQTTQWLQTISLMGQI